MAGEQSVIQERSINCTYNHLLVLDPKNSVSSSAKKVSVSFAVSGGALLFPLSLTIVGAGFLAPRAVKGSAGAVDALESTIVDAWAS